MKKTMKKCKASSEEQEESPQLHAMMKKKTITEGGVHSIEKGRQMFPLQTNGAFQSGMPECQSRPTPAP